MKKSIKKLVLSRETLRVIQEDALATAVPGGATATCTVRGASNCTPCQTFETVPPCVTS